MTTPRRRPYSYAPRFLLLLLVAIFAFAPAAIGADTTPPTVSISSPGVSNVVSGTITVSVTASDDTAVSSVDIFLDGAQAGARDSSAPYSWSVDTTKVRNGYRTFIAIARDAAGNFTRSAIIPVTVTNAVALKIGSGSFTPVDLGPVISANIQEAGDQYLMVNPIDGSTNIQVNYMTSSFVTDPLQIVTINTSNNVIRRISGAPGRPAWSMIHTNGKVYVGTSDPGYLFQYDMATGATNAAIPMHVSGTYFVGTLDAGETDGKIWIGQYTPTGGALASYDPATSTFNQIGILTNTGSGQYAYTVGQQGDFAYVGLGQLPWYLAIRNLTNNTTSFTFTGSNDLGGLIFHQKLGGLIYRRQRSDSVFEWYNLTNGTVVSISTPSASLYYDYTYQKKNQVKDATTFLANYSKEINMDDGYPTSVRNYVTVGYRTSPTTNWTYASVTNGFIFQPQKVKQIYQVSANEVLGFTDFYGPVFKFNLTSPATTFIGMPQYELHDGLVQEYGPIYLTGYTSSTLQYNPTNAWNLNGIVTPTSTNYNAHKLPFAFGKYHRFVQLGADGMLYIGVNHLRDSTGGELAWYDPQNRTNGSNRSSFLNDDVAHMIPALGATKMIYASYATDGSTNAKVFVFDVATKTIDRTFYPIPGATQLDKIVEISPGVIFGASGTTIFKADVLTGTVNYRTNFPKETLYLDWSSHEYDHRLTLGPDGYVWLFGSNTLYRVNPTDGSYTNLVNTGGRTVNFVGRDIILAGNTNLYRISDALMPDLSVNYTTNYFFTNSTAIQVTDNSVATTYPSKILVSGVTETVTNVTVTLKNIGHLFPDDIDILLVGPRGQRVMLMSDAGAGGDITGIDLTFSPLATTGLPDFTTITNVSATYLPTDHEPTDSMTLPAPPRAFGYTTNMASAFNGQDPNGEWKLYALDDDVADTYVITNGWYIMLQTVSSTNIIQPARLISWSDSVNGVPGGIPTTWTNFCDVTVSIPGTNIVAIPNSTNDCAVAIATAIQLASANGAASNRVVYMPAGTYLLKTNISAGGISGFATLHNVILRGAGTNATILQADFTNNTASIFNIGGFSQNGTARSNFVDVVVGSTNLWWTNTTGISAGTMVMLWENDASTNVYSPGPSNGSADPIHYQNPNGTKATAAAPLVRQLFMVQSVSGSNITVWPPSNFDFHANYSQGLVFQTYSTRYFGLENFTLKNMPGGLGTNTLNNILMTQTYGCWVKNVLSENAKFAHINAQYCLQNSVFGSRLVGAPATGPSQGVGIHYASHNTNWKTENNVFDSNFPAVELYLGSSGMAFMLNAAVNCKGGLQAFDFHNAHHSKNLFEGNIANAVGNDGYFGSSEQSTLHRNWLHGTPADTGFRRCVDLGSFSREWSIVNNVLGDESVAWVFDGTFTNGWSGGLAAIYRSQPNMGSTTFTGTNSSRFATNTAALDLYCYTNLIRHANFDNATDTTIYDPTIATLVSPVSLYSTYNSTTAPTWYTNAVWPPIGTELSTMTNGNMAWNYYYGASVGGGATSSRRGFRAFRF